MARRILHMIFDYAAGDLAPAEIISALIYGLPDDVYPHLTSVPSFDTMSTGFAMAQLGLAEPPQRPEGTIIFANCAPRQDRRTKRQNNAGEGLLWGTLRNGVEIIGVNSGYTFSLLRNDLVHLRKTSAPDRGSQFRSRDFFPSVVCQLAHGDLSFGREDVLADLKCKEVRPGLVGYIDSFENLKTTWRAGDPFLASLRPGQRVRVSIGGIVKTATVATGSFNVKEGDLAFAPGSSGHDRRFWELFQRGGKAALEFRRPLTETPISIAV